MRSTNTLKKVVTALFGTLLVLQLLDLHSTVISLGSRTETNQVILGMSEFLGLAGGVYLAKAAAVLAILLLARAWRRSFGLDAPVAVALAAMSGLYALVVFSNYVS